MKLSILTKNKCRKRVSFFLLLVIACFLMWGASCSKGSPEISGRILSIDLPKRTFQPGETLSVHVRIQNQGEAKAHFLIVLNILRGDETVYDSHHGKKSHSHKGDECIDTWLEPEADQRIGPFVYRIPTEANPGTYHVLAGLRKYPWEPSLVFCGARWCPPETMFEIRKR